MIAVDTNVLVYAHRRESRLGNAAHALMKELAEGDSSWAIPWPCCYEFLSVATNRRIWKDKASSQDQAWRQLEAWTESPTMRFIGETDDFAATLERFLRRPHVVGGVVHDARIAAICDAHGVDELVSRDRDFSVFPELPVRDPSCSPATLHAQARSSPCSSTRAPRKPTAFVPSARSTPRPDS
ncbi:MAG: PIN domain-containing protein [Gammaproteobacteria bacterium]|nr:PIN domain-containing protein [Gammaproteobacteria bacterium]